MFKKSISFLLIIFMIFSIANITYAIEDDFEEELDEYQEEITEENEDETEETVEDEQIEETEEENQEDPSQTISNEALEEYFENSLAELEHTNTLLKTLSFLWSVWFIIDFIRHSFFNGRR